MGWSEYKIYTDKLAELSNIFNELIYLCDNFDINRLDKFIISIIENYDFYILEDENDELSNGYSDLDDDYKLSEDILACDEYINMIEYINENFKKMYEKYTLYINKIESLSNIYLEDLRQVNVSVIENFKSEYNAVIFNLELLEQQLSYIPNENNIVDKKGIFNIDVLLITNNSIMYGFGYNFLKSYFIKNLHVINKDTYDITYSDQTEFNNKINKIYLNVYKVFIKTLINGKAKKFNGDFQKELKLNIKRFKAESKIEQDKAASEIESLKDKKKLEDDEKRQKEEEKAKRKEKEIKDAEEDTQKVAERAVDELKTTLDIDNKTNALLDKTIKEEAKKAKEKAEEEAEAAKKAEEEEAEAAKKAEEEAEAAKKAKEEAEVAKKAKEEAEVAKKATEEEANKKKTEEEAKKANAATKPEQVEKSPDTTDANVKKLLNILNTYDAYIKTLEGKKAHNLGLDNEQKVIYINFQHWFETTYPDLKDKISGIPSLSAKSLQSSSPPIYSPPPIPQRNNSIHPAYPPIPHLQNTVYPPTYQPPIPLQNYSIPPTYLPPIPPQYNSSRSIMPQQVQGIQQSIQQVQPVKAAQAVQATQQPQQQDKVSDKSATTYEYPSDKPLSSKGPPVKENLQESIKFLNSDERVFQRYIPDDIWKRIINISGQRDGWNVKKKEMQKIIEKWNNKYIDYNNKLERWAKERKDYPEKVKKEEEAFDKKEKEKRDYWIKKRWEENYWDAEKTTRTKNARGRPDIMTFESYNQEIRSIGEIPGYFKSWDYSGEINAEKNIDNHLG